MKRYRVYAFAEPAPDVLGQLDAHTDSCIDAMAQLWLFPNYPEYHHHWVQEVWTELHKTKKMKSTKHFPTKKQIFKTTFEDNAHIIEAEMHAMVIKESDLTPDSSRLDDVDGFTEIVKGYLDWVAEELSKHGVIKSSNDTRAVLTKLGLV